MRLSDAVGRLTAVVALAATAGLLAAACSGEEATPESRRAVPERRPPPTSGVTPARYLTDLTFVSADSTRGVAYYRFHNRVTTGRLLRRYAAWAAGPGGDWERLFTLHDSLPTPRAGWRILPSSALRLTVKETGELASVRLERAGGRLRLDPDTTLSEWTGPTGQRERLRLARLRTGDRAQRGLLVERRKARPADSPPVPGADQLFLVTDRRGDGLLILRYADDAEAAGDGGEEPPAVVQAWIEGRRSRWGASLVASEGPPEDPGSPGPGTTWELDVPEAGITGRLRVGARAPGTTETGADMLTVARLDGSVRIRGRNRPVTGVLIHSRGP